MRTARTLTALLAAALLCAAAAPAAQAAFGLNGFEVEYLQADGSPADLAGSHPDAMETSFGINFHEEAGTPFVDGGDIKDLDLEQIKGLAGDTTAVATCTVIEFTTLVANRPSCADKTAVGLVAARVTNPDQALPAALFNLEPPPGVPVRLGFIIAEVPVTIDVGLKQEPDYNVLARQRNIPQTLTVFGAAARIWGVPADPAHDFARGACKNGAFKSTDPSEILRPDGKLNLKDEGEAEISPQCPAEGAPERPLLTMPRSCEGPLASAYRLDPWDDPGAWVGASVALAPAAMRGCGQLAFLPGISSRASADTAESGSGLDFQLDFEDPVDGSGKGLIEPDGRAQSDLKKAVVTLPEGVTANPSLAEGLDVCTPADLQRETLAAEAGEGCPNAAKIGSVSVQTPIVDEDVAGSVFIAEPDDPATAAPGAENPFDSLIAFYIVLKSKPLGVIVKVPAEVEPDPATGQLVTTVDDAPQIPFTRFSFRFREGQRAPLITPPGCGTYTTVAELTPWARPAEPLTRTASFQITRGVGGGPCPPGGAPPFDPGFEAGSDNNAAGGFSPFRMRLIRHDGEQDLTRFSSVLPPGVLGRLAGVGKCPEAAIALARAKSGRGELAAPSCPAGSRIGSTLAGAGVGSSLTYVPGSLYLAGPYNGDPLSVVSVTPAVAGPFDAGTVVVRVALDLDPVSGEVKADGAASDPIPHILKGIPLKVRDLRVNVDRPSFTLNPTSCAPSSARATLWGSYLDVFNPADDVPVARQARYQAAGCARLGFKPRLGLKLFGRGTRRGGFPRLRAVYTPRSGDANLRRLALAFPTSAFIEQGHFRTICTRVQFAAGAGFGSQCPKGAIYGRARVWTPLLDEPLQGPVYLRSSDHNLPDAVFALRGIVDIEATVRIDSVRGRLRAIVQDVPDAPVSRAIVDMQGGQKGLFVNSRNLCHKPGRNRARANVAGHNGKFSKTRPVVRAVKCQKRRKAKREAKRSAHRSKAGVQGS